MITILVVIAIILLLAYFATGVAIGIGGLIIALIVWAVIGWLAGQLMKGGGYGLLGDILLGLVGGLVGGLLFRLLGIGVGAGFIGDIIVGVIGAIVVIVIGRALKGRRIA